MGEKKPYFREHKTPAEKDATDFLADIADAISAIRDGVPIFLSDNMEDFPAPRNALSRRIADGIEDVVRISDFGGPLLDVLREINGNLGSIDQTLERMENILSERNE